MSALRTLNINLSRFRLPSSRAAVLEALDTYLSRLKLLSLDDVDVIPGNTPERLDQRLRLSTAKVAALTPFAAVGTVMNVVPYQAMRLVWRRPMTLR